MNHLSVEKLFVRHLRLARIQIRMLVVVLQPDLTVIWPLLIEDLVHRVVAHLSSMRESDDFLVSEILLELDRCRGS